MQDKLSSGMKKRVRRPVTQAIAYQAFFTSPDGKAILWDLMKNHNVIGSTFSKDTHEMALKEGERNVVLRILQILKIDVEELARRIDEGLKEDSSNN